LVINFKNKKFEKCCNTLKEAQKKWGTQQGKKVLDRLNEMRDADNMLILMSIPQARCHPLTGDRKGQWSVNLKHPYRLIFELVSEPLPRSKGGGLDMAKITEVKIIGVEDTHG